MVDNIISFPGVVIDTEEEQEEEYVVTVDDILENAKGTNLEDLILVGRTRDGLLYLASTSANFPDLIYDLESAKHIIMMSSTTLA